MAVYRAKNLSTTENVVVYNTFIVPEGNPTTMMGMMTMILIVSVIVANGYRTGYEVCLTSGCFVRKTRRVAA